MIIPSKHSGYQAGIRLYPGGAIGGGGGFAQPLTGADYNRRLQAGETSQNIRNSTKGLFGAGMSDANWGAMVQDAGMNSPTGRPMAGSDQFFQPVYNSQYQNYAQPNTQANVSMYGTQPQQQGGFGGFDPEVFNPIRGQQQGGFGGFGSNQITASLQNQGPAQRQTYENYLKDIGDMHVLPQTREQFNAEQNQLGQQRQQGMNMLGRGNMNEIMAGLGGQQQGGFGGLDQNAINANPRAFFDFKRGAAAQEQQYPGSTMLSDMQYRGPTQSQPSQPGSFGGFGGLGGLISGMLQKGGFGQQMQSPFSFQQPAPQQMQSPFSYQQPAPQQPAPQQPAPQQPSFQQPAPQQPSYQQPAPQQPSYQQPAPQQPSYQQPSYQQPAPQQPSYQQPSYQQPAPQQPSYQQPSYQQPAPQQPSYEQPSYQQPAPQQQPAVQPVLQRTSSGPTSAIVGRSAGLRGTPNVMQYRAKGGIASLMDDVE